jgi:arginyl-tRNA synthetase
LIDLLNEGARRALVTFKERVEQGNEGDQSKVQLDESEWAKSAETLGISAIKYYDFNKDRKTQYIFDFDAVLDPRGNTGVYLIYQYVRICSIIRKSGLTSEKIEEMVNGGEKFSISH